MFAQFHTYWFFLKVENDRGSCTYVPANRERKSMTRSSLPQGTPAPEPIRSKLQRRAYTASTLSPPRAGTLALGNRGQVRISLGIAIAFSDVTDAVCFVELEPSSTPVLLVTCCGRKQLMLAVVSVQLGAVPRWWVVKGRPPGESYCILYWIDSLKWTVLLAWLRNVLNGLSVKLTIDVSKHNSHVVGPVRTQGATVAINIRDIMANYAN